MCGLEAHETFHLFQDFHDFSGTVSQPPSRHPEGSRFDSRHITVNGTVDSDLHFKWYVLINEQLPYQLMVAIMTMHKQKQKKLNNYQN